MNINNTIQNNAKSLSLKTFSKIILTDYEGVV